MGGGRDAVPVAMHEAGVPNDLIPNNVADEFLCGVWGVLSLAHAEEE